MKVITLWQPWASLIILGEKKFETRSFPTAHRDELGIHAGINTTMLTMFYKEPFLRVFKKHGFTQPSQLPLGKIIGAVDITNCMQMVGAFDPKRNLKYKDSSPAFIDITNRILVPDQEIAFGDWKIGRFAWDMKHATPCHPIAARGYQMMWEYDGELMPL